MRVRNVRGTSWRRSCRCGDWLDHYYRHGGTGRVCVACRATPVVGAHVWLEADLLMKLLGNDRRTGEHIVPLCAACNKQEGWMDTVVRFALVPANTQHMGCATRGR